MSDTLRSNNAGCVSFPSARGPADPPVCILDAEVGQWPCRIRSLSARGAFLEMVARPPLGTEVYLFHPEVGAIVADVSAHRLDGIAVEFILTEESSAFAIAVHAHDMTRPADPAQRAG